MRDRERLEAENRRLSAGQARLREEVEHTREQFGYALHEVAELRKRIPGTVTQAAASERESAVRSNVLFGAMRSA